MKVKTEDWKLYLTSAFRGFIVQFTYVHNDLIVGFRVKILYKNYFYSANIPQDKETVVLIDNSAWSTYRSNLVILIKLFSSCLAVADHLKLR